MSSGLVSFFSPARLQTSPTFYFSIFFSPDVPPYYSLCFAAIHVPPWVNSDILPIVYMHTWHLPSRSPTYWGSHVTSPFLIRDYIRCLILLLHPLLFGLSLWHLGVAHCCNHSLGWMCTYHRFHNALGGYSTFLKVTFKAFIFRVQIFYFLTTDSQTDSTHTFEYRELTDCRPSTSVNSWWSIFILDSVFHVSMC